MQGGACVYTLLSLTKLILKRMHCPHTSSAVSHRPTDHNSAVRTWGVLGTAGVYGGVYRWSLVILIGCYYPMNMRAT